jgi:hypothetical protein
MLEFRMDAKKAGAIGVGALLLASIVSAKFEDLHVDDPRTTGRSDADRRRDNFDIHGQRFHAALSGFHGL